MKEKLTGINKEKRQKQKKKSNPKVKKRKKKYINKWLPIFFIAIQDIDVN